MEARAAAKRKYLRFNQHLQEAADEEEEEEEEETTTASVRVLTPVPRYRNPFFAVSLG